MQHFEGIAVDCRPDKDPGAIDFDFRFVDDYLRPILVVGLEEVVQPVELLANCLM